MSAAEVEVTDLAIGAGATAKLGCRRRKTRARSRRNRFHRSAPDEPPLRFELGMGEVIEGWERGILGMRAGGKRSLRIPPALAYGTRGAEPLIPPNATLVFEIELVAVE